MNNPVEPTRLPTGPELTISGPAIDPSACMTAESSVRHYLELGLAVFPCAPGQKQPATRHGFKDAMHLPSLPADRAAKVRESLSAGIDWKGCNVGIRTGVQIDVLDVDVKDGKPGLRALRTLKDAGLLDGAVATAKTPSGGWHVYFPTSGEKSKSIPALGLDWKAQGGYVLAAPSTIMKIQDGGLILPRYEWSWTRPFDEGSCLVWEDVTSALGVKSAERERTWVSDPTISTDDTVAGLAVWLRAQPIDRNKCLHWAACRAAEAGARTREELRPLFEASASLQRPDDGADRLDDNGELWKTIESALRSAS